MKITPEAQAALKTEDEPVESMDAVKTAKQLTTLLCAAEEQAHRPADGAEVKSYVCAGDDFFQLIYPSVAFSSKATQFERRYAAPSKLQSAVSK